LDNPLLGQKLSCSFEERRPHSPSPLRTIDIELVDFRGNAPVFQAHQESHDEISDQPIPFLGYPNFPEAGFFEDFRDQLLVFFGLKSPDLFKFSISSGHGQKFGHIPDFARANFKFWHGHGAYLAPRGHWVNRWAGFPLLAFSDRIL
jgi:hypothetical protein